jgi:hypothetical protein
VILVDFSKSARYLNSKYQLLSFNPDGFRRLFDIFSKQKMILLIFAKQISPENQSEGIFKTMLGFSNKIAYLEFKNLKCLEYLPYEFRLRKLTLSFYFLRMDYG